MTYLGVCLFFYKVGVLLKRMTYLGGEYTFLRGCNFSIKDDIPCILIGCIRGMVFM